MEISVITVNPAYAHTFKSTYNQNSPASRKFIHYFYPILTGLDFKI
jgi:hypothetical protein